MKDDPVPWEIAVRIAPQSPQIAVFDGGRVVAIGSHAELLDTSPRELATHQLLVA